MLFLTNKNYSDFLKGVVRSNNARYHYFSDCELLNSDYVEDELVVPNTGNIELPEELIPQLETLSVKECMNCGLMRKVETKNKRLDELRTYIIFNPDRLNRIQMYEKVEKALKEYGCIWEERIEFFFTFRKRLL